MANYTTDPVTGINIPTVGVDPGPDYAVNISNALETLAHLTHTGASNLDGYQIPTAGLNINADLPLQSNNLIGARSVRFTSQSSTLSGLGDVGCAYVNSGNLYYNNGSGVPIQITSGSNVYVTATGLLNETSTSSNLTIPSTASYNYISVDSTSGSINITLPTAASVGSGRFFYVKDVQGVSNVNNIIIRTAGDTMDGVTSFTLSEAYQSALFVGDGNSNWMVQQYDKTNYNYNEQLTFNYGSTLSMVTGSNLINDGYVKLDGTVYIDGLITQRNNTNNLYNNTTNLDSNCIISNSGTSTFQSGSSQEFKIGSTLKIDSSVNFYSQPFAQFITPVYRTLTTPFIKGVAVSTSSWLYQPYAMQSQAAGSFLALPLDLHNGATLTSMNIYFTVTNSHTGGVPATLPLGQVSRLDTSGNLVSLSTTYYQSPPTPANAAAWYNGGAIQHFTMTFNQYNVIDTSQYTYQLTITDEQGTNSTSGNNYYFVSSYLTNISSQIWSF